VMLALCADEGKPIQKIDSEGGPVSSALHPDTENLLRNHAPDRGCVMACRPLDVAL